ncbi:Arm DNA-binding domain-containing protein [Carboxylicivirga sp. N1Y90]|uniref:Arm DNA-binding domain-containing protein n=1 Tax=Carboxylicivirga fragile TaxID=3417571 RepID=UPI003D3480C1|nr:hypothetical protein [Marinilabiliaceae bacterium N1Y90]
MRLITNYAIKKSKVKKDGTCPLYIRVTLNQRRVELSTGICIDPLDWNEINQQIDSKTPSSKTYNTRLKKIITDLNDFYNQLVSIGKPFDIIDIKNKYLGKSNAVGFLVVFDYYIKTITSDRLIF